MTVTEWEGTSWAGTAVEPKASWTLGPGAAQVVAKAATGWEQFAYSGGAMNSVVSRSPLKRMREEQALYWSHPWIRVAERAVTRRVAGLPWHLETDDDEVEDDTTNPKLRVIRTLLEKPQAALPANERQPGIDSWANLEAITSRHMGLCGVSHWFPDQPDRNGLPLALLYINPARLYPVTTTTGQLVAWSLDPKDDYGRGGTILGRDEVLTFYLEPPDWGGLSAGLVHAAWLKAQITQHGDAHFLDTLDSGGRLAGLVTPKVGTLEPEEFAIADRELRNAQEAPDSSKRLTIIRGPIEYHRTTGTSQELDLSTYSSMTRSDILTVWGVPDSSEGIPSPAGLNSGDRPAAEEAGLMKGSVHDRVRVIHDTVQFGLLDRYEVTGISPQLVIEEPTFEDETPAYKLAETAKDLPLTRNERRAITNHDPLPEYGPDGAPLGLAIDLPLMLTVVGQGPEADRPEPAGNFGNAPIILPAAIPQIPAVLPKAGPLARETITQRYEPGIRKAVAAFLAEQAYAVAAKVREKGDHLARKGAADHDVWWDAKRWDAKLLGAIKQGLGGLTASVVAKVTASLGQKAKADPFTEAVLNAILRTIATRVGGINATTRDTIAALIGQGFADGLAPAQIAALIEDAASFDPTRAELIARTETALVYNEAAVRSYGELGVEMVEAIDGDEDDECRDRVAGNPYTIEEAMAIEDHPNGTLDWLPVTGKAEPLTKRRTVRAPDGREWVFEESVA